LSVDEALARISADREEGVNTFEKKENLQKVSEIYLKLAEKFPELFHVVDVHDSIQAVQEELQTFISNFLEKR
ncbi:MAG: hypothetical protein ACTSO5_13765, partial [Candidatus Heimdallarchaeaceae archaeon]